MVDITMFLVKAKVNASMKEQKYDAYIKLIQQTKDANFSNCNCKSGKGGGLQTCCPSFVHSVRLFKSKVISEDITYTRGPQQWNVPSKRRGHAIEAANVNEFEFEKADFERLYKSKETAC